MDSDARHVFMVQKTPAKCVGVDDSSNNRLGSSVAERPACNGVDPGSIPGLAFSFSSYEMYEFKRQVGQS